MSRWTKHSGYGYDKGDPAGSYLHINIKSLDDESQMAGHRAFHGHRRSAVRILGTVFLSVLIHVALVFPVLNELMVTAKAKQRTQVVYTVQPHKKKRTKKLASANRSQNRRARKERQVQEPEEPPVRGQVVQLPPPDEVKKPTSADYLSEWDQDTDRETRSRHQTNEFTNPTRRPQVGQRRQPNIVQSAPKTAVPVIQNGTNGGPAGKGNALDGSEGPDSSQAPSEPNLVLQLPQERRQTGLFLDFRENGTIRNRSAKSQTISEHSEMRLALGRTPTEENLKAEGRRSGIGRAARGGRGADGLPGLVELTPTLSDLDRIMGMPANDYLPDVETDAETRLRAWRWKHSPFFNRMANGLRRNWHGAEVIRERDPTTRIYGTAGMSTVLNVSIDKSGNLVSVSVRDSSGARFFDDEAIAAFRRTAPFLHPPKALFGGKDEIAFSFGFHVSYDSRQIDFDWRPY